MNSTNPPKPTSYVKVRSSVSLPHTHSCLSLKHKEMYNTCASSTVSLRCKGSLSFSSNDYFHFLNDGLDRNLMPLSSSCCPCCANSIYRVPINPGFLYGLKQSTLIQWSASRRLILCGGEGYSSRSPIHDVHKKCNYGNSWSLKERSVGGRRGRWRQGRFGCAVSEERSKRCHLSGVDDAEVILSLLTEEVSEECFGVRERNDSSSRRVKVEKRGNGSGNCYRGKKKNVDSGLLESNSKCEFESVTIQSREEDYRRKSDRQKEDKENSLRGENCRLRKEGSSHSSYYSFSSLDELESDDKVQVEYDGFAGESSSGYKRVPRGSEEATFNREVVEEVKRPIDVAEGHGIVLKQENTAVGLYTALSDFDCHWRKKSEKKLSEESIEHTLSRKESSQQHSELLEVHETGYEKVPKYHKQYDNREEKSTSAMNIDEGTRHRHSQTGHQVTLESKSRTRYKQFTEMPEIHGGDVEMTSSSQKQFRGEEGKVGVAVSSVQERRDEHCKTAGHVTGQDEYRRKSQQLTEASEHQEINIRGTSTSERLSETRMKNREDNSTVVLNFVQDTEEQHHRAGQWGTGRKSSQSTDISDTHAIDIGNKPTLQNQSDTRMRQEDSSNFVISSFPEEKEQHLLTHLKAIKRMESGRESHDVTNISMVHSSDTQKVNKSQSASEKRMSSQKIYSSSVVKPVEGTRERHNLTDERVVQSESRKEDQVPAEALSFSEGILKGASSSQADLQLQPQAMVQQIGVDEGDTRSSQAIVTAPTSQLVERGLLHDNVTSVFATQETPSECLESDYGVSHTHSQVSSPALQHEIYGGSRREETYQTPLNFVSHEGALDSADRLQKSSMHFVGDFVEKVRHEISTSETQKEKKTCETMLVSKGEKSRYGSGDSQAKKHESRHSSQSSGTKGPSDDMWDVTDPSIQGTPKAEIPEVTTTTGNVIAKRTGRSLLNIIGDIIRLRWASRSETHSSTVKSGGRTSSNQSNGSDTWFSGHEPDESNDENAKKDEKSKPEEATSTDLRQVGKIPTQDQGEGSSSMEKIRHVGMGTPSSSSILESGSASESISLASGEQNVGWKEDGKKSQGISSGTAIVESSPLAARRIRRAPIVEETSEAGKTAISGSGIMVQMEQPIHAGLSKALGTEGKDGELKRRKLQRNNQVMKDRFDEWEEAYTLETEQRKLDEMFMREALLEAKKAGDTWEVPVGAVLVQHGRIIARGCNLVEELRDSTAHAEMICIREASNLLRSWRLSETTLYVTLEPCPMCAGAILQARIDTVVWGAPNKLLGADGSWIRLFPNGAGGDGLEPTDKPAAPVHPFHPNMTIRRGVLASECADVMQQFFQLRRRKKEKKSDPPSPPSCLPISNHPSKLLTKMHGIFNIMFCL